MSSGSVDKNVKRPKKKSGPSKLATEPNDGLNLPQPIIDSIERILSAPIVNDEILASRAQQQFKTQLLEIRNAEDIEAAVYHKHQASLALDVGLDAPGSHSIVESSNDATGAHMQRGSVDALTGSKSRTRKSAKPAPPPGYLEEVESISNHYTRYLNRLKQLEGLRAAMMEAPPMPSDQLKNAVRMAPNTHPVDVQKVGNSKHHEVYTDGASDENEWQTTETGPAKVPDVLAESNGMAFMWGPVFNAGGSIADSSLYSSIPAPSGVQYLDFQQDDVPENQEEFGSAMSGTDIQQNSPGSRRSSRSASRSVSPVVVSTSQSRSDSPTNPTIESTHLDHPQSQMDTMEPAAPVVMFWGNIMQTDPLDALDDGTPSGSGYLTRSSSYRSVRSDSSAAIPAEVDDQHFAAEETELPAWIEALAAETAEIREEFQQEDDILMQNLGARLSQMDATNITVQSRRALLVQYSMDGVVSEYREKLRHMKAAMGLKPSSSRPGTAAGGDGDGAGGQTAGAEHEEKRAMEESEDSRPVEAPQINTRRLSVDAQLEQRRLSNKGIFETRGEIQLKAEIQEQETAEARDIQQMEDELVMQQLILSLTQAHFQATDNKVTASEPKSALQSEKLPNSAAEHRIGALLLQTEQREEQDKEARESHEASDDLALQQWLLAVTAFDAGRARKQTLRTLQLEELEDRMGDDSDGAESVASTSKSATAPSAESTPAAVTTISVPENNSLAAIKTLYRQSCSKMLASLPELNVDFTIDETEQPDFRMQARTKLQFARRILKASSNVDHKVAVEYRKFLNFCSLRRADLAMQLSEAMLKVSQLERSYRERYAEATREFKSSADAVLAESSDVVKHVTTSKHMQAIKQAAELDIHQQGQVVRTLQANEAKLILDTRYEVGVMLV